MLSFVEFLSQIFSRCLTGDLNHGQLLAIASHVAGGLTDTVIVVFLYQKVCGWSKSFQFIFHSYCDHNQTNLYPEALLKISHTTHNRATFAAIVHFPWKQIMTEAIKQRKGGKNSAGFIWYQRSTDTSQIFLMGFLNNDFYFIAFVSAQSGIKVIWS